MRRLPNRNRVLPNQTKPNDTEPNRTKPNTLRLKIKRGFSRKGEFSHPPFQITFSREPLFVFCHELLGLERIETVQIRPFFLCLSVCLSVFGDIFRLLHLCPSVESLSVWPFSVRPSLPRGGKQLISSTISYDSEMENTARRM